MREWRDKGSGGKGGEEEKGRISGVGWEEGRKE